MSDIRVIAVAIDKVQKHPNADKLDVATIGEYTTIVGRDEFKIGDICAFFPPDIQIPEGIAKQFGVAKYLKSALYPGDDKKTHCLVAAARLRGVPSFGFVQRIKDVPVGTDLTNRFHAVKYEPPEPLWQNSGDQIRSDSRFHCYTNIENYRNSRFKGAFKVGTPVRVTEKIHGTNSRVALLGGNYFCGSHKTNKKEFDANNNRTLYWTPLTPDMQAMLWYFAENYGENVIVFGEIYGSKIQFLDYGIKGQSGYRVFDVAVNGKYLNWGEVESACKRFCIPTIPVLYVGPFYENLVDQLVDGKTFLTEAENIKSTFKGREGIVLTPLYEEYSDIMGGRLIAKAVSVDYLEKRKSDSH